jgi:hypothetical protein
MKEESDAVGAGTTFALGQRGGAVEILDWVVATIACIVLVAGFCGEAYASDSETSADVRCVVVGLRMANMTAQQSRAAGIVMATYYLGRLGSRSSHAEIEQLIESEAQKMTSEEFQTNVTRCGRALAAEGQEIQKITADLLRKGRGEAPEK